MDIELINIKKLLKKTSKKQKFKCGERIQDPVTREQLSFDYLARQLSGDSIVCLALCYTSGKYYVSTGSNSEKKKQEALSLFKAFKDYQNGGSYSQLESCVMASHFRRWVLHRAGKLQSLLTSLVECAGIADVTLKDEQTINLKKRVEIFLNEFRSFNQFVTIYKKQFFPADGRKLNSKAQLELQLYNLIGAELFRRVIKEADSCYGFFKEIYKSKSMPLGRSNKQKFFEAFFGAATSPYRPFLRLWSRLQEFHKPYSDFVKVTKLIKERRFPGSFSQVEYVPGTAHAELLIFEAIRKLKVQEVVYIGISKLCCVPCASLLKKINGQLGCVCKYRGQHGKVYADWPIEGLSFLTVELCASVYTELKAFSESKACANYPKLQEEGSSGSSSSSETEPPNPKNKGAVDIPNYSGHAYEIDLSAQQLHKVVAYFGITGPKVYPEAWIEVRKKIRLSNLFDDRELEHTKYLWVSMRLVDIIHQKAMLRSVEEANEICRQVKTEYLSSSDMLKDCLSNLIAAWENTFGVPLIPRPRILPADRNLFQYGDGTWNWICPGCRNINLEADENCNKCYRDPWNCPFCEKRNSAYDYQCMAFRCSSWKTKWVRNEEL